MTRPQVRNGLGLSAADAEREVRAIEAGMTFLPDGKPSIESGAGLLCNRRYWAFRYTMRV
jgi:hypothetical protein